MSEEMFPVYGDLESPGFVVVLNELFWGVSVLLPQTDFLFSSVSEDLSVNSGVKFIS